MNFLINYKEQCSSNENFILIKQIDTMQQTIINDNGTDYNIKKLKWNKGAKGIKTHYLSSNKMGKGNKMSLLKFHVDYKKQ